MKRVTILLMLALALPAAAETVRIDLNGPTEPVPAELKPGLFYNNTTSQANTIFDTCGITCNLMRCSDIEYYLRTSSSYQNVMSRVRSMRSLYEDRARRCDRFVILLAGMPYWLSRSQDSTPTGSGWRRFMTVGPRDYAVWDSLMRDIAAEVRTWRLAPWYEFWNEPDLRDFWSGTETELIGLYRHTAEAIKSADPNAKVGGFAVNYWYKGIDSQMPTVYGWIPDSLIRRYAASAHLVDSCALAGIPLDFVSWHMFAPYPYMIDQAANFFRRQLDSAGLSATDLFMTEYNASGSLREKPPQPGLMVRFNERMAAREVRHSVAAYQDFSSDPTREFFGDYGLLSRGALCKPAFKALQLLSEVTLLGRLLPVELQTDGRLTVLATRQGQRVRVLLANSFLQPLMDGWDALLWNGVHRINTLDLAAAGYTSNAQIDSVITGINPPHGPPEVIAAFEDANYAWTCASQWYCSPRTVELHLAGLADTCRGTMAVLDTFTNNVIFRYDSLIGAGWARSAAVSYLYTHQDITRDSLVVPDSVFSIDLTPNAVVLLDLEGVQTVGVGSPAAAPAGLRLEPVPTVARSSLCFSLHCPCATDVRIDLFDATGRRCRTTSTRLSRGRHFINWNGCDDFGRAVASGVYYWRLSANGFARSGRTVLAR